MQNLVEVAEITSLTAFCWGFFLSLNSLCCSSLDDFGPLSLPLSPQIIG